VQSEFTLTLVSVGDKKIQVLKELRAVTQLGLKEAKDIIDKTPSVIKENVSKEDAAKIKAKLEEVGAKVEVK
jgi:large subunit ribosomal protein L7/L12